MERCINGTQMINCPPTFNTRCTSFTTTHGSTKCSRIFADHQVYSVILERQPMSITDERWFAILKMLDVEVDVMVTRSCRGCRSMPCYRPNQE